MLLYYYILCYSIIFYSILLYVIQLYYILFCSILPRGAQPLRPRGRGRGEGVVELRDSEDPLPPPLLYYILIILSTSSYMSNMLSYCLLLIQHGTLHYPLFISHYALLHETPRRADTGAGRLSAGLRGSRLPPKGPAGRRRGRRRLVRVRVRLRPYDVMRTRKTDVPRYSICLSLSLSLSLTLSLSPSPAPSLSLS